MQNFAAEVKHYPNTPYTGEDILFIIKVWNTSTTGYPGAFVGWEVCPPLHANCLTHGRHLVC